MLSPGNVATPLTAACASVPASVPLLGFVPIATVMFPVNPVAVLPPASWAVTSTAGVIAAPAVEVLGCTENTSCVAVPAVMLNAALVVLPAPVDVSASSSATHARRGPAAPQNPANTPGPPAAAPAPPFPWAHRHC